VINSKFGDVSHSLWFFPWLMGNHFWLALPFAGQRASVLGAGVFFFSALTLARHY
jgi:hypothetical protein